MQTEVKQFAGILNTDDDSYVMPSIHHKMANNIRFRGNGKMMRAETVPGTTIVPNSLLLSGTNITIGSYFDSVKQRVFVFNYNSNGNHGIYLFDVNAQTFSALLVVGGATDGDILGFTPDVPIHSINVLYSELVDGDMLFYIDSDLRPTSFNINRYLNNPYTITKRAYIDVAKAPPQMPPQCTYCNDFTVTVNNMRNALFQFKEKFVFDDFQKSVISSGSIVPLPNTLLDINAIAQPQWLNARIDIFVSTGDADVKKLEIWGRQVTDSGATNQTTDTATTDYFLITSLDKTQLSIPDNDIWTFRFYNDGVYPIGDLKENTLLFDAVPREANTQELLNGNVPIYGGITEGYDKVNVNINLSSSLETVFPQNTYNGLLFFASQGGVSSGGSGNNIKIILSGTAVNDSSGNPYDLSASSSPYTISPISGFDRFQVDCATTSGSSLKFFYDDITNPSNSLIPFILAQLGAAAVSQGFTVVTSDSNSITVSHANVVLYGSQVINNATVPGIYASNPYDNVHFAYPHQSAEDYALMYFDSKGRTNGASVLANTLINTPEDVTTNSLPQIQLSITSRPPIWAKYYQVLRAANLTYNKHLFWISNQTFTNVDLDSNIKYAYIGITNMVLYNENNNASTPVVNYDFSAGDRVRFDIRYPSGYPNPLTPASNLQAQDYEIVSVEINPTLKGVPQIGRFLKIVYPPSADITSNFDFGGAEFQNYKILIYNYIKRVVDPSTQTYFEFGRQYGIGNAGTVNAFHIGSTQTQTADLVTPAIIKMDEGQFFWRMRNVPAGASYYEAAGNFAFKEQYATFYVQPDGADVINTEYTVSHQQNLAAGILATDYPTFTDDKMLFWNTSANPTTIRVRAKDVKVQCKASDSTFTSVQLKIVTASTVTLVPLLARFDLPLGENLIFYTFDFDGYAQIPANAKCWIIAQNGRQVENIRYGIFTLELDVVKNINIPIIESSYSDKYNIVINSNSRPAVFDPNARSVYYSTLARWGLPFQLDTNINQTNRFYPDNFDEYDRGKGDIRRFKVRDRIMRIFQDRACGEIQIFAKFLLDSGTKNLLSTTSDIISSNNINYYSGNYGLDGYPTSLVSTRIADYFPDVTHGYFIRLSGDGLVPISELYKGQFYLRSLLTPYNKTWTRSNGFAANIIGVYNYLEEEYVAILQGGSNGTSTVNDYTLSFNEKRNAFCSFFDFHPDAALSVNEDIYTFVGGELYIHNSTTNCNFYDQQYDSSITLVFNDKQAVKKSFKSIGYQSNQIWESRTNGDILTSLINSQTGLQQISQLQDVNYTIKEGYRTAALRRDANSRPFPVDGLINGDKLKGVYLECKLTYRNAAQFGFLFAPYLNWISSQRNF